jgi:hypothetical protein
MRKIAIAALIAATLSAPLSVSAAQYECKDGTILSTGTTIKKSFVNPQGELITTTSILEGKTPFVYWQKAECRADTAKNLADAFDYAAIVEAYSSKWGIWTLEELFPERFGK